MRFGTRRLDPIPHFCSNTDAYLKGRANLCELSWPVTRTCYIRQKFIADENQIVITALICNSLKALLTFEVCRLHGHWPRVQRLQVSRPSLFLAF